MIINKLELWKLVPTVVWYNDRFEGTSIIELSEGDNLGEGLYKHADNRDTS